MLEPRLEGITTNVNPEASATQSQEQNNPTSNEEITNVHLSDQEAILAANPTERFNELTLREFIQSWHVDLSSNDYKTTSPKKAFCDKYEFDTKTLDAYLKRIRKAIKALLPLHAFLDGLTKSGLKRYVRFNQLFSVYDTNALKPPEKGVTRIAKLLGHCKINDILQGNITPPEHTDSHSDNHLSIETVITTHKDTTPFSLKRFNLQLTLREFIESWQVDGSSNDYDSSAVKKAFCDKNGLKESFIDQYLNLIKQGIIRLLSSYDFSTDLTQDDLKYFRFSSLLNAYNEQSKHLIRPTVVVRIADQFGDYKIKDILDGKINPPEHTHQSLVNDFSSEVAVATNNDLPTPLPDVTDMVLETYLPLDGTMFSPTRADNEELLHSMPSHHEAYTAEKENVQSESPSNRPYLDMALADSGASALMSHSISNNPEKGVEFDCATNTVNIDFGVGQVETEKNEMTLPFPPTDQHILTSPIFSMFATTETMESVPSNKISEDNAVVRKRKR